MPAVSITRAVKVLFVPEIKVTASSAVAHTLLLPVATTQFMPSALTSSDSSLAKMESSAKVKITLTLPLLVIRSPSVPVSLLIATVCMPVGILGALVSKV